MPHISPETLERLFQRHQDITMCVHGIRTRIQGSGSAVVRIVGHLALEQVPEEDGQELPEEYCLVVELPMTASKLAVVTGHLDDTMGRMVDSALNAIITEDGET